MNRSCEPFEHELSAYVDGELPAAERARIEAHLGTCARCAAELRELRHVGDTLRRWDAHEARSAPSTGFRNRVLLEVGGAGVASSPAETRVWSRAAWAAAAAASVVGAFAWVSQRTGGAGSIDLAAAENRARSAESALEGIAGASAPVASGHTRVAADRLGMVPPVLGPGSLAGAAPGQSPSPQDVVAWEVRGDGLLHPDAVAEFDRQMSEKRRLTMEERIVRMETREGSGDPGTTAGTVVAPLSAFLTQAAVSATHFPPFEDVQIWPVELTSAPRGKAPWIAERAIDGSVLRVSEDASGAVVAQNVDTKDRPVLLLAGDVLRGARRDRVVREDMLLQTGRSVYVPSFGASAPRETSYRSFTRSRLLAPFDVRATVATASLGAATNQSEVDAVVNASLQRLGSNGNERSIENLYSNGELQRVVSGYVEAFRKRLDRPNVVGFASAVGGRLLGIEVCGDTETFRAVRDRLLASHVIFACSAPDIERHAEPPADSAVQALLTAAAGSIFSEPEASGDGTLSVFRSVTGDVFGSGVLDGTHLVHATVFAGVPDVGPADEGEKAPRGPMGRPLPRPSAGNGLSTGPDRSAGEPARPGIDGR